MKKDKTTAQIHSDRLVHLNNWCVFLFFLFFIPVTILSENLLCSPNGTGIFRNSSSESSGLVLQYQQEDVQAKQTWLDDSRPVCYPLCQRPASRRQNKAVTQDTEVVLFPLKDVILTEKIPAEYFFRIFHHASLQYKTCLFVRAGPEKMLLI